MTKHNDTRILQKGKKFKIQVFNKGVFRERWKDLYRNCYCGDGCIRWQVAIFDSIEEAQEGIKEFKEEMATKKAGWQVIEH